MDTIYNETQRKGGKYSGEGSEIADVQAGEESVVSDSPLAGEYTAVA